jgi:hypothetical protein
MSFGETRSIWKSGLLSQLLHHTDSTDCEGCSDETWDLDGWPNRCACGGWRHAWLDAFSVRTADVVPPVVCWCATCREVEAIPGH